MPALPRCSWVACVLPQCSTLVLQLLFESTCLFGGFGLWGLGRGALGSSGRVHLLGFGAQLLWAAFLACCPGMGRHVAHAGGAQRVICAVGCALGGTGAKYTDSYCLQGVCEQLCCSMLCSLIAHLARCTLPAFMQGWGGVMCIVALRGGPGQFLLLAFWASKGGYWRLSRLMWGVLTFKIKPGALGGTHSLIWRQGGMFSSQAM